MGIPRPARCASPRTARPTIRQSLAGVVIAPGVWVDGRKPRVIVTVAQHSSKVRCAFRMLRRTLGVVVIPPHVAGEGRPVSTREESARPEEGDLPCAVFGDLLPSGHYPAASYDLTGSFEALSTLLGAPYVTGWQYALSEAREPSAPGGGPDKLPPGKGKRHKGGRGHNPSQLDWEYRQRVLTHADCARAAIAVGLELR